MNIFLDLFFVFALVEIIGIFAFIVYAIWQSYR